MPTQVAPFSLYAVETRPSSECYEHGRYDDQDQRQQHAWEVTIPICMAADDVFVYLEDRARVVITPSQIMNYLQFLQDVSRPSRDDWHAGDPEYSEVALPSSSPQSDSSTGIGACPSPFSLPPSAVTILSTSVNRTAALVLDSYCWLLAAPPSFPSRLLQKALLTCLQMQQFAYGVPPPPLIQHPRPPVGVPRLLHMPLQIAEQTLKVNSFLKPVLSEALVLCGLFCSCSSLRLALLPFSQAPSPVNSLEYLLEAVCNGASWTAPITGNLSSRKQDSVQHPTSFHSCPTDGSAPSEPSQRSLFSGADISPRTGIAVDGSAHVDGDAPQWDTENADGTTPAASTLGISPVVQGEGRSASVGPLWGLQRMPSPGVGSEGVAHVSRRDHRLRVSEYSQNSNAIVFHLFNRRIDWLLEGIIAEEVFSRAAIVQLCLSQYTVASSARFVNRVMSDLLLRPQSPFALLSRVSSIAPVPTSGIPMAPAGSVAPILAAPLLDFLNGKGLPGIVWWRGSVALSFLPPVEGLEALFTWYLSEVSHESVGENLSSSSREANAELRCYKIYLPASVKASIRAVTSVVSATPLGVAPKSADVDRLSRTAGLNSLSNEIPDLQTAASLDASTDAVRWYLRVFNTDQSNMTPAYDSSSSAVQMSANSPAISVYTIPTIEGHSADFSRDDEKENVHSGDSNSLVCLHLAMMSDGVTTLAVLLDPAASDLLRSSSGWSEIWCPAWDFVEAITNGTCGTPLTSDSASPDNMAEVTVGIRPHASQVSTEIQAPLSDSPSPAHAWLYAKHRELLNMDSVSTAAFAFDAMSSSVHGIGALTTDAKIQSEAVLLYSLGDVVAPCAMPASLATLRSAQVYASVFPSAVPLPLPDRLSGTSPHRTRTLVFRHPAVAFCSRALGDRSTVTIAASNSGPLETFLAADKLASVDPFLVSTAPSYK